MDENGEPNGYICEHPAFVIAKELPTDLEDTKKYLPAWQNIALANGYTAVADAVMEIFYPETAKAYHEPEEEGKLKLRTCSYVLVPENPENPKAEIARAVAARAKYSGNYFFIVGVKTFLDGVVEAHTGRMLDDYLDKPGYHGLERFNNREKNG